MRGSVNNTIERVLEAMKELEIEPLFETNSGYYSFAYFGLDMLLATDFPEGDVCIAAEFAIDFSKCEAVLERLSDIVNKDNCGFVVREAFPGVGFVAKTWSNERDNDLSAESLLEMLVELHEAWNTIARNIFREMISVIVEEGFYPELPLVAEERLNPVFESSSFHSQRPVSAISEMGDDVVRFSIDLDSFDDPNPIIAIRFACDEGELPPTIIEFGFKSYYNAPLEKKYPGWEFYRVEPSTSIGRSAVLAKTCPPLCAAEVAYYDRSQNKLCKLLDFYE